MKKYSDIDTNTIDLSYYKTSYLGFKKEPYERELWQFLNSTGNEYLLSVYQGLDLANQMSEAQYYRDYRSGYRAPHYEHFHATFKNQQNIV